MNIIIRKTAYIKPDTERIHESERTEIKYLKNDALLPLPEERDRDTRKAIAKSRKIRFW